jgi:HEAT repeat protein
MSGVRQRIGLCLLVLLACARGQVRSGEAGSDRDATDVKVVCDRWPDGSSLRRFALDAVRLSGARTEKEKALAVFRWMRRWTMFTNGKAPRERGRNVLDDLKILHVYGAHWCDGRALCMENLWRSIGGRAWKLYVPPGYTMALVHWKDDDGVERWHQMHCSRGWYVYDRAGKCVAHPDQIGADLSLMLRPSRTGVPRSGHPPRPWNWIAVSHRSFSRHDVTLDLRRGESYSRQWGNEGIPAFDNVSKDQYPDGEHGAYEVTYGNGRLISSIDPGGARAVGARMELAWPVRAPHVLADAWLEGRFPKGLTARFSPDGKNDFALPGPRDGRLELGRKCTGAKKVVGRYAYVLKLSWPAAAKPAGSFRLVNVVQHNMFSLPQLWPGRNRIAVSGKLARGAALLVSYEWDDAGGKGKRSAVRVERAPFTYEIVAGGRRWADVRCRRLVVKCVSADGKGNRVVAREPEAKFSPLPAPKSMDAIVGAKPPAPLKKTAEYLADLAAGGDAKVIEALDALMVLRDPKAAPALKAMIYSEADLPLDVRGRAMQALYRSLPAEKAFAILLPVVRRDEQVKWIAAQKGRGWKSLSSLVAHLAADAGYRKALPDLLAAYKRGVGIWNRMTYLRAFGKFKAKESVPLCIRSLRYHSDVSASAAWALGEIGDASAAPHIVRAVEGRMARRPHQMILYAWGAEALGKLGARSAEALKLLEKLLAHADEEVRGAAADALGRVGASRHIALLNAAAAREAFPWVKRKMLASAGRLTEDAGG